MFKTLLNLFRSTDKNSLEALKQHAEQGDAEAIYQLGRVYALGKGEEVDYDKAMTLYHRANALGYPLAANNIGALYDDMGEPEKSVEWFEQGIRQGDKRATISLGRFYLLGIGVEQDTFKGMQMLEKYDNHGLASYLLAQVYDGVIGYKVPINYPKALEYYLLAEKNKQDLTNEDLMTLYNNLGTLYNAHEDIPTNYAEAQKYLTKAAEMGLPHAMYGLANLHGFKGDKKQAFKWYLKAAENGLIDAYYYVGNAYKRGEGVQQDSQKALKWLELAAEYQMRDAARELAEIYQDGLDNVPQNLEKAQAFYLLAKESGENVERSVQQLQSRLAVRDDFGALLERAKEGNLEAQKIASKFILHYAIIKFLYQAIFVYLYGATLGKLAVKIYCVRADGSSMDIATAAIRAAVRLISEMIFYMGFLVALFTNSRQSLHDMAAKTLVVEIEKE